MQDTQELGTVYIGADDSANQVMTLSLIHI